MTKEKEGEKRGPGRPRGGEAPESVRAYWRRKKREEREREKEGEGCES